MIGRDRRYGRNRQASLKARLGIATAVLVGGGAIGVAAVAATSHSPSAAKSAGFSHSFGASHQASHYLNEGSALNAALSDWSWSQQQSFNQLQRMAPMRTFSQTWQHHTQLAVQRGIVVLVTRKFVIVKSANGSLHLWLLSGNTRFRDVSSSWNGTNALTGNTQATNAAMSSTGNMTPATNLLAGSLTTANQMLAPAVKPVTVTVNVAGTGVTVTVTVTSTTATVAQTTGTTTSTIVQNAFMATHTLARGDLALIAGVRTHGFLHAQLVLFTPLSSTSTGTGTSTSTGTGTNTGTGTGTSGLESGTHT